ncbi:MAG: DUF4280 domain-containing protein [Alphaproteobacteria bacterium]|nr:DUF4280 domain-containing protein [Alphaproteobacteria bacterium]
MGGQQVVNGAPCMCSFGMAPSSLMVLPTNCVNASKMPAATIMDNIPFLNILPFAMCTSLANPAVAAATAAAAGVLTPMPCTPVIPAPWAAGDPKVTIAKKPALTNSSTLTCAYGGVITITFAGQATVTV